jgi:hypothetical protein
MLTLRILLTWQISYSPSHLDSSTCCDADLQLPHRPRNSKPQITTTCYLQLVLGDGNPARLSWQPCGHQYSTMVGDIIARTCRNRYCQCLVEEQWGQRARLNCRSISWSGLCNLSARHISEGDRQNRESSGQGTFTLTKNFLIESTHSSKAFGNFASSALQNRFNHPPLATSWPHIPSYPIDLYPSRHLNISIST